MQPLSPDEQVLILRQVGGFACPVDYALIEIGGKDACQFLQARVTNDVAGLEDGDGLSVAFLDRKAHVQALGTIHRLGETYLILAEQNQIQPIIKDLNEYVFNQKVEIRDLTDSGQLMALQGGLSRKLLSGGTNGGMLPGFKKYGITGLELWGQKITLIARSITGEDGYLLFVPSDHANVVKLEICQAGEALGFVELTSDALNTARIEAGLPLYGVDVSQDNLLPETGLEEESVSYSKGCYLGQEVIARIKTFGAPKRGLVGIIFEADRALPLPFNTVLPVNGKEIGAVKSSAWSPTLESLIAFAYVDREYRAPGQVLEVDFNGGRARAQVVQLPFYQAKSNQARANQCYEAGLAEFSTGDEAKAILHLRDALILDPLLADAYEALGVILSRQENLDEAISLMKKLAELDSVSVMAHANLSVFYMRQGNKEAAEEEKAIAMSIRMSQIAKGVDTEKKQKEDEKAKRKEAKSRSEMFRQVLDIDPDDLFANYGLGSMHVDLGEFDQSIPLLTRAIQIKPTHSVAYLALGQAYQGLNRLKEATQTYQQGIAVAAKRGDMTPLKAMQAQLDQLSSGAGSV